MPQSIYFADVVKVNAHTVIIMQNVTQASQLVKSKSGGRVSFPRSSNLNKGAAADARNQGIKREKAA
ncbi:hypothetical protein J41TS12_34840 [Paenibacillus antibioticophila]|uniref:Uncharacterized protein n=1 Tax=Paenibacillus antibioticophila TaxID=1274374 RepID=A0A920CIC8_9BACL|nr:hypothetical protein J41TS12_34840 [Paenibacillus antibioticophila]